MVPVLLVGFLDWILGFSDNQPMTSWLLDSSYQVQIIFLLWLFFLRAVLSLQKKWRADSEISHIPPASTPYAQPPSSSTSPAGWVVGCDQWTSTDTSQLPKVCSLCHGSFSVLAMYGFRQMCNDMYALLWYHVDCLRALRFLWFHWRIPPMQQ